MNILKFTILSLLILGCSLAWSQQSSPLAQKISEGKEAYLDGDIATALRLFSEVQVDYPDHPIINFNLGDIFYRQQDFDKALSAFEIAFEATDDIIAAKALYNIGNCLVKQGKLEEALVKYKEALKLVRDDEDTKYNIEYVQKKLKEIEKDKKKDDKEKDDPLKKLLKRLDKLIAVQASTIVENQSVLNDYSYFSTNLASILLPIVSQQTTNGMEALDIQLAFKSLLTNFPPEQLSSTGQSNSSLSGTPAQASAPQMQAETTELISIFNELVAAGNYLQGALTNGSFNSVAPYLAEVLPKFDKSYNSTNNQNYASKAYTALSQLKEAMDAPRDQIGPKLNIAGQAFNDLMQKIQRELQQKNNPQSPLAVGQKTLAMKITNAVDFIEVACLQSDLARQFLDTVWTNAISAENICLDNLIRARKEFDDDKNKQNQNNKQDKKDQDKKDQDKKDQDKKDQDKKDQDKKDQDKKDQDKKDQDQKDQDQKDQDQKDQDQSQQQQAKDKPKKAEMDKNQTQQMLKNFEENQKNKRKERNKKVLGGYVPVDKDW